MEYDGGGLLIKSNQASPERGGLILIVGFADTITPHSSFLTPHSMKLLAAANDTALFQRYCLIIYCAFGVSCLSPSIESFT